MNDSPDNEEKLEIKDDPLHEMRERFEFCKTAWKDNRKRYVEDQKFAAGEQWPDEIVKERERRGQPCLVVDKLNQYVRQVVNDSRQNRPSIKIRPVDSNADPETAEMMQGLVRHIEDRSMADVAYDTALECAVKGGMGFLRVLTEYSHDVTFEQDICIKRIRNPLTVWLDPNCQEPDYSDAKFGFVIEELSEDEYKSLYPKAKTKSDIETDNTTKNDWVGEKIRIAEYFEVVQKDRTLHLLEDGQTATDEEYQQAIKEGIAVPKIIESRVVPHSEVMWSKTNGVEYLKEPQKWPGKYIPIVPVWGNEVDIEGEVTYTGLINSAKDAARLYNYSRSAFAERVALAPKSPYIAAVGQVENYPEWEDANHNNYSTLTYDPVEVGGTLVGAPQRQPASDIPAGFAQDMQLSEHDIQGALGMYSASLGQQGNEKSGKAIIARQREGDTGTFHYHDNLSRAIRHLGRILVDLIPKVYDSKRVLRIIGIDGETSNVSVDPKLPKASVKIGNKTIYNLNVGIYDVTVSSGPSYTTKRQEAVDGMAQVFQGNPQLMSIIGDLFFRNTDWPGSEEIADRLKLMLPPNIQQAEQKEDEQTPEVAAVVAQAQQVIQQKDQSLQQAVEYIKQLQGDMAELKAKADSKEGDTQAKMGELQIKQAELTLKERELLIKEQDSQVKAFTAETDRMTVTNPEFEEWKVRYEADVKLELARINAEKELELARLNGGQKMAEKAMDQMIPAADVEVISV